MSANPDAQSLICLENIAVRLGAQLILENTSWDIRIGQHWVIMGPNGAGKSSLVRAVAGEVPVVRGNVFRQKNASPKNIGYVSFELHRHLIAREEARDESREFSGKWDNLTTARQTILGDNYHHDSARFGQIVEQLDIAYLLDRGIRFLSTGEMRNVMIARAVMTSPRILILDEPFDGLDVSARNRMARSVSSLMNNGLRHETGHETQMILVTHREKEILPEISHVLCIKDCQVVLQGPRNEILSRIGELWTSRKSLNITLPASSRPHSPVSPRSQAPAWERGDVLVSMKDVTVKYGNTVVLKNLNWTMKAGENWVILGSNGAGKTTLLSLITGDNLQSYANEIYLFGRRRGTGESIWEIKQQIGMVSNELQIRYRHTLTAYDVVLSGFFDSMGLYRNAAPRQKDIAHEWIRYLGLEDKADRQFDQLSYGERRMVLIARAVVKSPVLLILDEPCQGLDMANREMVLALIDLIGRNTDTHLLYVTHHEEEIPGSMTHILRLEKTG